MKPYEVLILGGGFAGIRAAQKLLQRAKNTPKKIAIRLISDKDYFEYYPAMYRVATGSTPLAATVPLLDIFRDYSVEIVIDKVLSIDPQGKKVVGASGTTYHADALVVALGSQNNYFNIQGLEELSFNFRSINQAVRLQNRVKELFEQHAHADRDEQLVAFHFVVVGAGASGVELAGELALYTRECARMCGVPASVITINLVEAASRVLPSFPEKVSAHVEERLRKLGVNILLNRTLIKNDSWTVFLKDMKLGARTVIWTAGVKNNELIQSAGFPLSPKGRVIVNDYLEAEGSENVFVVGDGAETLYSGLAQTALLDGSYVARVITDRLRNKTPKIYHPKKNAYDVPVGPGWGVFVWKNRVLYGRLAWWVRILIDFSFFLSILPLSRVISISREVRKNQRDVC